VPTLGFQSSRGKFIVLSETLLCNSVSDVADVIVL